MGFLSLENLGTITKCKQVGHICKDSPLKSEAPGSTQVANTSVVKRAPLPMPVDELTTINWNSSMIAKCEGNLSATSNNNTEGFDRAG